MKREDYFESFKQQVSHQKEMRNEYQSSVNRITEESVEVLKAYKKLLEEQGFRVEFDYNGTTYTFKVLNDRGRFYVLRQSYQFLSNDFEMEQSYQINENNLVTKKLENAFPRIMESWTQESFEASLQNFLTRVSRDLV